MGTVEYKYETGKKVFTLVGGIPYNRQEIEGKIQECIIEKVSFESTNDGVNIRYNVKGSFGRDNIPEESLYQTKNEAYKELRRIISDHIKEETIILDRFKDLKQIILNRINGGKR